MNYPAASRRSIKIVFYIVRCKQWSINSFIPTRCAIGIRSTYKFQFITFLKFEFHE